MTSNLSKYLTIKHQNGSSLKSFGLMVSNYDNTVDRLCYLILDPDFNAPMWVMSEELVEVGAIPSNWELGWTKWHQPICGYSELVKNAEHQIELLERKQSALEIFANNYLESTDEESIVIKGRLYTL